MGIIRAIFENQRKAILYKRVLQEIICMAGTDCPSVIANSDDNTADMALDLVQLLKTRVRKLEVAQGNCCDCRCNPPKD